MKPVLRITLLTLVLAVLPAAGSAASGTPASIAIVDSLGGVPTDTVFSLFGSSGQGIDARTFSGPSFTLSQPTRITEIGAFANTCGGRPGIPSCPTTRPAVVQIRPDAGGVPDVASVLASFELSHDDEPFAIAYESVETDITLPAGRYYALFGTQGDDAGIVLQSASIPFRHTAESVDAGVIEDGRASRTQLFGAYRVLGIPGAAEVDVRLTGPTSLLADGDVIVFDDAGRGHRLRAGPAMAEQLAMYAGRTLTIVGTAVEDPGVVPHYPIRVTDFRVEPAGAFDGQIVVLVGDTARLPDGGVIVYDSFGRGHRLRGTGEIGLEIERLAGQHLVVRGLASVTNGAARLTWPIDLTHVPVPLD